MVYNITIFNRNCLFLLFQCFKGPPSGTPRGEGMLRVPHRKFDLECLSWAIWQHPLKLARILKTSGCNIPPTNKRYPDEEYIRNGIQNGFKRGHNHHMYQMQ